MYPDSLESRQHLNEKWSCSDIIFINALYTSLTLAACIIGTETLTLTCCIILMNSHNHNDWAPDFYE